MASTVYFVLLMCGILVLSATGSGGAEPVTANLDTSPVTIVLPPKLMAGHPATLAVLNEDGKLAAGIPVKIGAQMVVTDSTGRARFNAPSSSGYVIADASGIKAAALVDPAVAASEPRKVTLPPVVSLHNRLWICAPDLQGNADEDQVEINTQPALILAASPVCLVVLAPPATAPGRAVISIHAPGAQWQGATTFVSLQFESLRTALLPGKKARFVVMVRGSRQKLNLMIENQAPSVLRFIHGDMQRLRTRGGPENYVIVKVQTIRSGAYSFRASVIPAPNFVAAQRYLQAAEALALLSQSRTPPRDLARLAREVSRRPSHLKNIHAQLAEILAAASPGDFRTLISAADSCL